MPPAREVGAARATSSRTLILLTASVALMMTGYGIVFPVLGKRLGELGAGAGDLGLIIMAFALAQFLLAPFMGSLADRFGRRPIILLALGGFIVANIALLLADSASAFVVIRFFEGAITAGLLPATMAVVADSVAEEDRARWTGLVMGSYGYGIIFGPALGGLLYESWDFAAPFLASAALGAVALALAALLVSETRPPTAGNRPARSDTSSVTSRVTGLIAALPRPLYVFATLLLLDFLAIFIFGFVEPRMVFFFYDDLDFSATQFGIVVGAYGLTMTIGQGVLGGVSDRVGRTGPIVAGFLLNVGFYLGLAITRDFGMLVALALVAGFGTALLTPALGALYLDMSPETHRARVMGLKESAAALGGVVGPLAVTVVNDWLSSYAIFVIGGTIPALAALVAFLVLGGRRKRSPNPMACAP